MVELLGRDKWENLNQVEKEKLAKIYHAKCAMHVGVNISKYFAKGFALYWSKEGKQGPINLPPSAEARLRRNAENG